MTKVHEKPPVPVEKPPVRGKEFYHLIRIQERLLNRLLDVRDELRAPSTRRLLRSVRSEAGADAGQDLSQVSALVEQAIREMKFIESETRQSVFDEAAEFEVSGIPALPATLARFIAERQETPGFSYDVREDPIRGWILRWKEYQANGTIRGCGQFYERPYAWLEE